MAIRMTRGEWRGLLVLGAVLAALLALMAWHRSGGRMADADVYELPGLVWPNVWIRWVRRLPIASHVLACASKRKYHASVCVVMSWTDQVRWMSDGQWLV